MTHIALWVFGLLFAYVLSVGPVAKLIDKGVIKEASVAPLYAPITWIIANWRPAEDAFAWYLTVVWRIDIGYR